MISFSSGRVPLPLLIFLYVSYMLADISVTLWCLLWYQTPVFRYPNPTSFFLLVLSKQNQLILPFWKWDKRITLAFWFMVSTVPWFTWMFQNAMAPLKLPECTTLPFLFLCHPERLTMLYNALSLRQGCYKEKKKLCIFCTVSYELS